MPDPTRHPRTDPRELVVVLGLLLACVLVGGACGALGAWAIMPAPKDAAVVIGQGTVPCRMGDHFTVQRQEDVGGVPVWFVACTPGRGAP